MQTQRIYGAQFVWPAQGREGNVNALFTKNRNHRVIVVAVRIAEDRKACADFSSKILLSTLNFLLHLFGRHFRHDGMRSGVGPDCEACS